VRPWFTTANLLRVLLCLLVCTAGQRLVADDPPAQKSGGTFFAGTVTESTAEKITVGRTVRGRAESRTFRLTPETEIEGTLAEKVRVTVRYITDDDGDTATLIVVRTPTRTARSKQKKP
jgi:hypothetical protein